MRLRRVVVLLPLLALVAGCTNGPPAAEIDSSPTPRPTETTGVQRYVALGDSFTAAPGVPSTDVRDPCLRSNGNYPSIVDRSLGQAAFVDVSCAGASSKALTSKQQATDNTVPPQFAALDKDTDLVTLGIGGNDFNLSGKLLSFCTQVAAADKTGAPCRDYMNGVGKNSFARSIARIEPRIEKALKRLHQRAPDATVIVVGYPQLVPAKGSCKALPLAAGDYPYVRMIFRRLDDALRRATRKGDARFVSMIKASAGHDICAKHPWVNGVFPDAKRALAYHPFSVEQEAVAKRVLDLL